MPMPPSTAWLIAPARLAMRLTVTTEPSRPNKIEERAPAKKALRTNGKSGETRAEKKVARSPMSYLLPALVGRDRLLVQYPLGAVVDLLKRMLDDRSGSRALIERIDAEDPVDEGGDLAHVVGDDEDRRLPLRVESVS